MTLRRRRGYELVAKTKRYITGLKLLLTRTKEYGAM
jgi:hypothetical protein